VRLTQSNTPATAAHATLLRRILGVSVAQARSAARGRGLSHPASQEGTHRPGHGRPHIPSVDQRHVRTQAGLPRPWRVLTMLQPVFGRTAVCCHGSPPTSTHRGGRWMIVVQIYAGATGRPNARQLDATLEGVRSHRTGDSRTRRWTTRSAEPPTLHSTRLTCAGRSSRGPTVARVCGGNQTRWAGQSCRHEVLGGDVNRRSNAGATSWSTAASVGWVSDGGEWRGSSTARCTKPQGGTLVARVGIGL
jgi:hypothetical protein